MSKVFFVDFDGTVTKKDTCVAMVEAFARDGWQEINELWEKKQISTEECANRTFELFDADMEDMRKLMESIEIDEYFPQFLKNCSEKGYKVYILSDGYDFCIGTILKKYCINLPYYANKLIYENGFRIECPYKNASCGRCGTCKTSLMFKLKEMGDEAVYIGDGYSDMCPAAAADVVYAKGSLLKYCRKKGIEANAYKNYKDIIMCFFG